MKTIFLRALEAHDKAATLLAAICKPELAFGRQRFEVDAASFSAVPRSPFAYWVSNNLRQLFKALPPFEAEGRTAKQGLATGNDPRFLRVWWEVSATRNSPNDNWSLLVKGGAPTTFYGDPCAVVKWFDDGLELKAFASHYRASRGWGDQWSAMINATELYFRPGFTWPLRASRFAPSVMPCGCAFSTRGCAGLAPVADLPWLISILSSSCFDLLFKMLLGRFGHPEFTSGALQEMPIPDLNPEMKSRLGSFFSKSWTRKRSLDTCSETSHAFALPALLQMGGDTMSARADGWADHIGRIEKELSTIKGEIDSSCFELYGINEADQRAITQGFSSTANGDVKLPDDDIDADAASDEDEDTVRSVDALTLAVEFVSWAVGVAFGRFDVRLATGARPLPAEPEPFDQLPACSPAMLTGDDGLPLTIPPAEYPIAFPENGLLVDDPGDALDLTTAVRAVFDEVFKESADTWWNDIEALLDPKDHDLRAWLAGKCFEHHLKRHSKSRRKAPIIWQLAVPSGRYSIWLYAHRVNRDTFIQIQNDIVAPKLVDEEHRLASLIQGPGANPTAKESKEIEAQETFVGELRDLFDKVKVVAPLWQPTLDDGVVLTMAPLWQLVPQHKSWQKELKSKWDELAAGKYDWAHVAMHLWPERVVPKCAEDRSLAIAHGLEDVFWFEDEDGKWKPNKKPQKSVASLVGERTSAAVKAALKSLLDAPDSATGAKRSRKSKAA